MDFGNFFESLWDMVKALIKAIGSVWNWLSEPIKVDILGISKELGYSPIELLGVSILVLLSLWVIKHLIPLG